MNWSQIVRELGPRLLRYFACRYSNERAADLVQETLVRLVNKVKAGAFDPAKGNLASYAFGIAHFINLEHLKKWTLEGEGVAIEDRLHLVAAGANPEEAYKQKELAALLRRAIGKLQTDEQQVVMLLVDEEISINDIAVILDMPAGTVKSHMHRTKEKLRKSMHLEMGGTYERST